MPTFTRSVPKDPRGPAFQIFRTPTSREMVAIITSPDLVGCFTHFWKGRTVPCDAPDCEACRDSIPYRWHAYQSAYNPNNGVHFLFECTAQAAEHFTDYRDNHDTIRGCLFRARRMNAKANGRIIIVCKPADLTSIKLPQPPDLIKCLAILWDFPVDDVAAERLNPEKKTPHVKHTPKKEPTA
ncbi:hypothetical protein ES703_101223 [subsurface metagenome]